MRFNDFQDGVAAAATDSDKTVILLGLGSTPVR